MLKNITSYFFVVIFLVGCFSNTPVKYNKSVSEKLPENVALNHLKLLNVTNHYIKGDVKCHYELDKVRFDGVTYNYEQLYIMNRQHFRNRIIKLCSQRSIKSNCCDVLAEFTPKKKAEIEQTVQKANTALVSLGANQ